MTDQPKSISDYVDEQEPRPDGTSARIQWKGTEVCMDFECKCGHGFHVDGEFVFYIKCPECNALYAMSPQIRVVEVPTEYAEEVTNGGLLWVEDVEDEPAEEPAQGWSMKNGVWSP